MTEIISPDNQLVDDGGISTQRTQIWLDQVTDLQIITGTGTPEGIVSANVSRLYLQTDGTDGAVLFIKQLSDIGGDPKYGWVVCGGGGSASIALEDLTDVTITSIATGELLKWNGSAWVNNTLSEAGVQPEEDQRLSTTDSVEFLSVTTGNVIATGNITVTGTVDGRDIAVDGIKLDGIEAGADVTDTDNVVASLTAGANITIAADGTISATSSGGNETLAETLVLGNTTGGTDISVSTGDNIVVATGSTVDGRNISVDGTKLDGIEDNADVTDTANVTAAGALMDSEVVNLDQVKNFDASDYATAAQGVTADNALPLAGGTMTGVISNFTSTGIDDNATSTQLTITDTDATFAGNVSIGSSAGTRPLYIVDGTSTGQTQNASANIILDDTAANLIEFLADAGEASVHGLYFSDDTTGRGRLLYTHSTDTMSFNTNSQTALTIDSSQNATLAGDINFSGASPNILLNADSDRLVVSGGDATSSGANIIFYGDSHYSNADKMIFRNSSTTALTINASSNATFAGDVTISKTTPNLLLEGTGVTKAGLQFKTNGTLRWDVNAPSGSADLVFDNGTVESLRLAASTGNATFANNVTVGNDLTIAGNEITYTGGFATNYIQVSEATDVELEFRNYGAGNLNATFDGEIDASAGGIYLGGTAAANHLDDYEEGTWTPTNYTGNIYNAKYIKIGNLVTVSVYLQGGAFTTNNIGGLPYSPNLNNRYVSGLIGYTDTTNVTASYTQTSSRLFLLTKQRPLLQIMTA